jgi:hypothetical protein
MTDSPKDLADDKHLIEILRRYFVNRDDTYAIQNPDGSYYRVEMPLTDEVLLSHLQGNTTVGVYQIEPEKNIVKWLCFDVDSKEMAEVEKLRDSIVKSNFCAEDNILVEDTGGRGYHLWIFFDPPIPALVAYYVGRKFEQVSKVNCEVFPKQKVVEAFGNLVKLPLGVHRKTGQRSTFASVSSLEEVARISVPEEEVAKAVQEAHRRESGWMERFASKGRGYSGEDPPCVRFWFSGVDPGNRNNVAIRLASYYRNFAKLGLDTTLERMLEWNARNSEPLPRAEITSIVGSADKGGYNYSCEDEFWKQGCQIEKCPLKIRELPVATGQVSDDVNAQVDELIEKGPIEFIRFLQQCNEYRLTGELKNRLFIATESAAVIQRMMMLRLLGENAVGKKKLLDMVEIYLGKDRIVTFGSTTGNTLKRRIRKGLDPKGKMFILSEERGEQDKELGVKYQFEIAYSDNVMEFDYNEPDGKGGWEPVNVKLEGPLGFATTSTDIEASGHAMTRESEVTPDNSMEQSNRIYWWERWRREIPLREIEREDSKLKVLTAYYARLRPFKNVVNPLIDYIRFKFKSVADRRKWPEFLGWIDDAAVLFQPWLPKDNETDSLIILPYVFDFISIITDEIVIQSRGGLTENEQFAVDYLAKHPELFRYTTKGQKPKVIGKDVYERQDEEPTCFKVSELSLAIKWKERWARTVLKGLTNKGYLETHGEYRTRVYSFPIGTTPDSRLESLRKEFIPRFGAISGEEINRQSEEFWRGVQEYAEHKLDKKLPPLGESPYCRLEFKPKNCLFQPEWPGSREFNRRRGSVPIEAQEGEKTAKITEKLPEGLWRDFSKEGEVIPSDLIKLLVRRGTRGQKRRGKLKRTRRPS